MQTFLFTDIEGSTRLWERHPGAMGLAIARQERILREAIDVRGGTVFNTAGDSVCAVFPAPDRAIAAAIDAQRHLLAEPWETYAPGLKIAVRMAVDAGEAEASGENFVGPVLNRLHRLMKTGHGGQILCTAAIAPHDLGPELRLRDLGSHPLRDIAERTQLYQLVAPGLPVAFPPLVTERPLPRQLPLPPATLFGRDADLEAIDQQLRERQARVVTLLGPGGVGKTSLALAVGRQLVDAFPDGVHFVDLSALRDGALVVPAIAGVLDIDDPLLSPEDALISRLQHRSLLLVLDNCEQVAGAVAAIVQRLIGATDGVIVLTTSRVPLRLRGERELRIEPLPTPTATEDPARNPAVQLFAEQARQVNNRFELSASAQPAVVDICRLVDGLPLAIELAAAWVRILDPATLHARLAQGAPLLKSDTRDRPERHRTLTSTIDWSYQLLSPDAQWAFGRLAVFQGGIPFDGALAVLQDGGRFSFVAALELIDTLVQANLLQTPTQTADGPRYLMLQTIQEFGLGRMAGHERRAACRAHASYFSSMAASAEMNYRRPDASVWLRRLDANIDNLRAAVAWLASATINRPDESLEMAIQLWDYFVFRNRLTDARALISAALDVSSPQPSPLRVRALALIGHTWLGQFEQAETFYHRSIAMATEVSGGIPPFDAITGLHAVAMNRGDFPTATLHVRDFLDHARKSERPDLVAQALLNLGQSLGEMNEAEEAFACWNESRHISERIGDEYGLAWLRAAEGRFQILQGNLTEAKSALREAIEMLEALGERQLNALCQLEIAKIAALQGDPVMARISLASSVKEIADGGSISGTLEAIRTGGIVLTLVLNQPDIALDLFAAADSWSSASGVRESPQRQAFGASVRQTAASQARNPSPLTRTTALSLRDAIELLQRSLS